MDIRTKLVFALVAVSLGSMLALGWAAYRQAGSALLGGNQDRLEAVVASKEEDLHKVLAGWKDRVRLIASRTRLRDAIREYSGWPDPALREQMGRILRDAQGSVFSIARLRVYDLSGQAIASSATSQPERLAPLDPVLLPPGSEADGVQLKAIAFEGGSELRAVFLARLEWDGAAIGMLETVFDAQALSDLTEDFTGLGRTGETLVSFYDADSIPRILCSGRHDVTPEALIIRDGESDLPAARALRGEEGIFLAAVDYRGEAVWAATRHLPEPAWGLVVKVDAAEEQEPVMALRRTMVRLGLSFSAFAVLCGVLLGLWFARPIRELAEVADRVRHGDLEARADVRTEDEVGLLARAFNEVVEELARSHHEDPQSGTGDAPS
jgi:HAMP domain-containing protein